MNGRFWLQAVLVISLAFNLAVVMMHFLKAPQRMEGHGPEAFEQRITHEMSPSDAAIVRHAFDRHKADFDDRHKIMETAIVNVRSILANDPVNRDQLDAAMNKARQARAAGELVMEQTMMDAAPLLSPDGRQKLVPLPSKMGDHGPGPGGPGLDACLHGPPPGGVDGPPPPPPEQR